MREWIGVFTLIGSLGAMSDFEEELECPRSNRRFVIDEPGGSYLEALEVKRHIFYEPLSCDV